PRRAPRVPTHGPAVPHEACATSGRPINVMAERITFTRPVCRVAGLVPQSGCLMLWRNDRIVVHRHVRNLIQTSVPRAATFFEQGDAVAISRRCVSIYLDVLRGFNQDRRRPIPDRAAVIRGVPT